MYHIVENITLMRLQQLFELQLEWTYDIFTASRPTSLRIPELNNRYLHPYDIPNDDSDSTVFRYEINEIFNSLQEL